MTATTHSRRAVARSLHASPRRNWPTSLGPEAEYDRNDPESLVQDAHHFAWAWFKHDDHNSLDEMIGELRLDYFHWEIDYADWHRNAQPIEAWVKAHLLREAKGWNHEKALVTYLKQKPHLVTALGFDKFPKQSDLWKWRHKKFSDELNDAIRGMASEITAIARHRQVPCPKEVFRPVKENKKKDELTIEATEEVYAEAKPHIEKHFSLNRGKNTQIPDEVYFEQHAFMGMREDMYAEDGATSFLAESEHDHTPTGSAHRWQLKKLGIEQTRQMHRDATNDLIKMARRNGELDGGHIAALDITKGHEYTGRKLDEHAGDEGDPVLGYKDGKYYHQWATIQIVGYDVPLILDGIPLRKGLSPRVELVDELLGIALEMVDDIDLLMMDREFQHDAIREVCLDHGVHPFTPLSKDQFEDELGELRDNEVRVRVDEQQTIGDAPTLKRIFVPKTVIRDDDEDDEDETEQMDVTTVRDELMEAFPGDLDEEDVAAEGHDPGDSALHTLGSRIEGKTEYTEHWNDGEFPEDMEYAVFQTTHPDASILDEDGEKLPWRDMMQLAATWVRRYKFRWGIENTYKKLKKFTVRTTSMDPQYRNFCFMFACLLYNVWRLVDTIVKVSLEGEHARYEPLVTANTFLTILKKLGGPVPPPPG